MSWAKVVPVKMEKRRWVRTKIRTLCTSALRKAFGKAERSVLDL